MDFREEKPTWMAFYRSRIKDGKCSLAQSSVGHDLRSEWFGVTVPIVMGELTISFDSKDGEKTFRGNRNQITKILRQNGYLISPFDLPKHSDF